MNLICWLRDHRWRCATCFCKRCGVAEDAVYDRRVPRTLPEHWRRLKIRWELSELRAVARLPVWYWVGGRPYRAVMRLAHRYGWHYMPATHVEGGDIMHWCQWCGLRHVERKRLTVGEQVDKLLAANQYGIGQRS